VLPSPFFGKQKDCRARGLLGWEKTPLALLSFVEQSGQTNNWLNCVFGYLCSRGCIWWMGWKWGGSQVRTNCRLGGGDGGLHRNHIQLIGLCHSTKICQY